MQIKFKSMQYSFARKSSNQILVTLQVSHCTATEVISIERLPVS